MSDNIINPQKHFGEKQSRHYDKRIRAILPGYEEMHQTAQYLLAQSLPEKASLLIAGFGTGHEAVCCARINPQWHITGVDPSEHMLAVAEERVRCCAFHDRIHLVRGTTGNLYEHTVFDAATAILVMQFLPDNGEKLKFLVDIAGRLRPGAKLILIDFEGSKHSEEYNLFIDAWKAYQHATRESREDIRKDFENIDRNIHPVPEERLRELLIEAGFGTIRRFYKSLLVGGYIATRTDAG